MIIGCKVLVQGWHRFLFGKEVARIRLGGSEKTKHFKGV